MGQGVSANRRNNNYHSVPIQQPLREVKEHDYSKEQFDQKKFPQLENFFVRIFNDKRSFYTSTERLPIGILQINVENSEARNKKTRKLTNDFFIDKPKDLELSQYINQRICDLLEKYDIKYLKKDHSENENSTSKNLRQKIKHVNES